MRPSRFLMVMFVLSAVLFALTGACEAQVFTSIHGFTGPDGAFPEGDLILDSSGNLYGVAEHGGSSSGVCTSVGCGTVFELSKTSSGGWKSSVLYTFTGGNDGLYPQAGLVFDGSGNLYGVTQQGGTYGAGVVFELSQTSGGGGWKETVLHAFKDLTDGGYPLGRLIIDASGNLYGTTTFGGSYYGVVFELSPLASGIWKETVLYRFTGFGNGEYPHGGVVFDAAGNLYGTLSQGGNRTGLCPSRGCGVVFELSPNSSGGWTESVLHSFSWIDGSEPLSSLIFDSSGNLYGTTIGGGSSPAYCVGLGCGVVYELSPTASGWSESVLLTFKPGATGIGPGGAEPISGLTFDGAGNLYGTALFGGISSDCVPQGCGVVFELSPGLAGGWNEAVLHAFSGGEDGAGPASSLALDAVTGHLFGTASSRGISGDCPNTGPGCGVVFQITP